MNDLEYYDNDVWACPDKSDDEIWDSFTVEFQFRPSVSPENWPTYREPTPSITYNINHQLREFNTWSDPQAAPYNLALLKSFLHCVAPDEPILALDWQHDCHAFYPHRMRKPELASKWAIPSLPSGEYHIFTTCDYRLGSLGHPWEQTVCIFGERFVDEYQMNSPLEATQIVRRNGRPIAG